MPITRTQIALRLTELERVNGQSGADREDPDLSSRWLQTLSLDDLDSLERALVDGDEPTQQQFWRQFHGWIAESAQPA